MLRSDISCWFYIAIFLLIISACTNWQAINKYNNNDIRSNFHSCREKSVTLVQIFYLVSVNHYYSVLVSEKKFNGHFSGKSKLASFPLDCLHWSLSWASPWDMPRLSIYFWHNPTRFLSDVPAVYIAPSISINTRSLSGWPSLYHLEN